MSPKLISMTTWKAVSSLTELAMLLWKTAAIYSGHISKYADFQDYVGNCLLWLCCQPISTCNNYIQRYYFKKLILVLHVLLVLRFALLLKHNFHSTKPLNNFESFRFFRFCKRFLGYGYQSRSIEVMGLLWLRWWF